MKHCDQFYIDGRWVDPAQPRSHEVVNPATEQPIATISLGGATDVDRAVAAARAAFESYAFSPKQERIGYLKRIVDIYKQRYEDMAQTISSEMGAPITLARKAQAAVGLAHFQQMVSVLETYPFEEGMGSSRIVREPIGVCGFITPWNWPMNQMACKVAPALAAGCTMVLKPSEMAPLSGYLLAQIIDEAGLPAGVFNLVNGDGPTVGAALASHPQVDMVSITGSTRAGAQVAHAAADSIKRVTQELGGKSANIILDDADLAEAVRGGIRSMMNNTGQSCNAPSRMLVPEAKYREAVELAREAAGQIQPGDPTEDGTVMGPLASRAQYEKVQGLIRKGIEEGATLVCGGPDRPATLERGYYVAPTVFADVRNDMTIAREEIFGPVLCMIPYKDEEEAVRIANDTPYGLAGYIQSGDPEHARRIAARIRAGMIHLNGAGPDFSVPFGGYKQSGNGREWGAYGLEEFLETKSIVGA